MRKAYASDLTDEQWSLIESMIPPAKPVGRPRTVSMREVLNTIFFILRTGCQWAFIPNDLIPKSTVHDYFKRWKEDGTFQKIMDALRSQVRTEAGREPTPSAACIDSQTTKTTEMGGEHGYDGGKKINGRKRHIIIDTMGLLLVVMVTTAAVDDGTTAPRVLEKLDGGALPRLNKIYGDNKYNNRQLDLWLAATGASFEVEVVHRPIGVKGFVLLNKRWVVERTFAWIGRYRRTSKDYERRTDSSEAMIKLCSINMMLRRLRPDKSKSGNSFNYRGKTGEN